MRLEANEFAFKLAVRPASLDANSESNFLTIMIRTSMQVLHPRAATIFRLG